MLVSISLVFCWMGPVQANQQLAIHKIEKGESLYQVSRTYHTSMEKLMELNPLDDREWLVEGQVLAVPSLQAPSGTVRYQVQQGDTLYTIAVDNDLTVDLICQKNGIYDPN